MIMPVNSFTSRQVLRRPHSATGIAIAAALLVMNLLCAAPLPPLGKVDVTGTIADAKWVPEASLKGRKGKSGSLGRDRVIPAHFVVTLRNYSGPNVRQAWMMNGFMGAKSEGAGDRDKFPPTLLVWVNSGDRDYLKAGMKLRLVNYTVTGDEGGTWTSCERVERFDDKRATEADIRTPGAIPRKFAARIGGMLSITFEVKFLDGVLVYSTERARKTSDPVKITPTADQWREFRAALDDLKVWKWEADYINRKVHDGTQWSLEIEYPDHLIKASGSNSYPEDDGRSNGQPQMTPAFGRYLAAVEKLLGGKPFK